MHDSYSAHIRCSLQNSNSNTYNKNYIYDLKHNTHTKEAIVSISDGKRVIEEINFRYSSFDSVSGYIILEARSSSNNIALYIQPLADLESSTNTAGTLSGTFGQNHDSVSLDVICDHDSYGDLNY